MKRYDLIVTKSYEHPDGTWVRADDPAILAAIEAMEKAMKELDSIAEWHATEKGRLRTQELDSIALRREALYLALSNLKGTA